MPTIRRTADIRDFILNNISDKNLVAHTVAKFGVSRAAVYNNINQLVSDRLIEHDSARKGRKYKLVSKEYDYEYEILPGISESNIWEKDIVELMPVKSNVRNIWSYGFTEMFNNAIDHSGGRHIHVKILINSVDTTMFIYDDGIGIFRNIKNKCNLLNEREAILELSKGKLTTDKQKHSGEGVFFTSRAFDSFYIFSYGINFSHNQNTDILLEDDVTDVQGTCVVMKIANNSDRVLSDVFDRFSGDDYGFDKTIIPIQLARYGDDNLVSRSQAKRVMMRANLFKSIMLDFTNVPQIGQAFADEIFRVFANEHPEIELGYLGANTNVEKMIKRAKSVIL